MESDVSGEIRAYDRTLERLEDISPEDKKALVEWFAWREMKTVYEGKGKLG